MKFNSNNYICAFHESSMWMISDVASGLKRVLSSDRSPDSLKVTFGRDVGPRVGRGVRQVLF